MDREDIDIFLVDVGGTADSLEVYGKGRYYDRSAKRWLGTGYNLQSGISWNGGIGGHGISFIAASHWLEFETAFKWWKYVKLYYKPWKRVVSGDQGCGS